MNDALEVLRVKWDLFVLALRTALLKLLGVDVMLERAFKEGWQMHSEADIGRIIRKYHGVVVTFSSIEQLDEIIHETRCWRSVDEAWRNSDAEEIFDESV